MRNRITVALSAVLLGAVGPLALPHPGTAGAASAVAKPSYKMVYKANWSNGLAKWKVYKGFKVSQGMLTYDGSSDAGAFAPFKTKGLTNFAVEASIKVGTATKPDRASYDLFVRRAYNNDKSGIFAGYDAYAGESSAQHVADLYWKGSLDNFVPGASLTPDASFHTYRMEVRGTAYRLLVDRKQLVPWTIITDDKTFNQVGVTFTYFPGIVKSFKVFALPAGAAKSDFNTGDLVNRAIAPTDLQVPPLVGIFRDNTLYAADSGYAVADLTTLGRLYGYLETFLNNDTFVSESINVHSSPTTAKAMYDSFVKDVRGASSKLRNYKEGSLPSTGVGDEAFAVSYDYDVQGKPSYVNLIIFYRGNYYVSMTADSSSLTTSQTVAAYAQKADKLVQSKP